MPGLGSRRDLNIDDYEKLMRHNEKPIIKEFLHVYLVPTSSWNKRRKLAGKYVYDQAISLGFVRVVPLLDLTGLREQISIEFDVNEALGEYVFLKRVGRHYTRVKKKQERHLNVSHFLPPETDHPEIYVLEQPTAVTPSNQHETILNEKNNIEWARDGKESDSSSAYDSDVQLGSLAGGTRDQQVFFVDSVVTLTPDFLGGRSYSNGLETAYKERIRELIDLDKRIRYDVPTARYRRYRPKKHYDRFDRVESNKNAIHLPPILTNHLPVRQLPSDFDDLRFEDGEFTSDEKGGYHLPDIKDKCYNGNGDSDSGVVGSELSGRRDEEEENKTKLVLPKIASASSNDSESPDSMHSEPGVQINIRRSSVSPLPHIGTQLTAHNITVADHDVIPVENDVFVDGITHPDNDIIFSAFANLDNIAGNDVTDPDNDVIRNDVTNIDSNELSVDSFLDEKSCGNSYTPTPFWKSYNKPNGKVSALPKLVKRSPSKKTNNSVDNMYRLKVDDFDSESNTSPGNVYMTSDGRRVLSSSRYHAGCPVYYDWFI